MTAGPPAPRPTPEYFESLFEGDDDPWRFRTRWYEARKRAMTLACLPAAHYASAYEPGCANGELSAALAERCDRLLVSDGAAAAVREAGRRLASMPQVEVRLARLPAQWPQAETFDLVVVSELGYYLDAAELAWMCQQARRSLRDGGTVLACHWRHPIAGCPLTGDEVHAGMDRCLGLHRLGGVVEADFRIDVWCRDARSVASREGLA